MTCGNRPATRLLALTALLACSCARTDGVDLGRMDVPANRDDSVALSDGRRLHVHCHELEICSVQITEEGAQPLWRDSHLLPYAEEPIVVIRATGRDGTIIRHGGDEYVIDDATGLVLHYPNRLEGGFCLAALGAYLAVLLLVWMFRALVARAATNRGEAPTSSSSREELEK